MDHVSILQEAKQSSDFPDLYRLFRCASTRGVNCCLYHVFLYRKVKCQNTTACVLCSLSSLLCTN